MSNFLIDEDTDLLAAEFVLGTLDSEERANAQSLLRRDHGFIAMVRIWERRFGELHLMVEPVEPDAKILQRIKVKIAEISPGEPVPEGKPTTEVVPSPPPPETTDSPARVDLPTPADVPAPVEMPEPQDVPAAGMAPMPAEVSATGETETPAGAPPAPEAAVATAAEIPAAAEVQPSPDSPPLEPVGTSEHEPIATGPIPAPPPLPPPPLKLPDKLADKVRDQRPDRRSEITIDVIRSRGRWRMVAVCMTLLVMGVGALLAAWRFAPDRLPAALRPAELLTFVGIQAPPKAPVPAVERPPPPVPQFDE